MDLLLRLSQNFMHFLTGTLVPFLTTVPDSLSIPFYNPLAEQLSYIEIPWLFGDLTFAELIVTTLIPAVLVIRLFKLLWDALPIA